MERSHVHALEFACIFKRLGVQLRFSSPRGKAKEDVVSSHRLPPPLYPLLEKRLPSLPKCTNASTKGN